MISAIVACMVTPLSLYAGCRSKDASPVMKDFKSWTVSGVAYDCADFSGLTMARGGKRMVAVFNSAGAYWMNIPQDGDNYLVFTPLWAAGTQYEMIKRDMEAVAVDPSNGDIYIAQERPSGKGGSVVYKGKSIYRLKAPAYDSEELLYTFDDSIVPDGNSGLEGLSWMKKGQLVVGREGNRQNKPSPALMFYSVKKGLKGVMAVDPEIKQIAEVSYDKVRRCYWILDSDYDKVLYRCSLDGKIIDRYPVPFIKNAEAMYIDRPGKCIWIGSDQKPSMLYKIYFDNL